MNTFEYSWHEQFYYFALFRALNDPNARPGKECNRPIEDETYYTQADLSAWIRVQNQDQMLFLEGKESDLAANQIKRSWTLWPSRGYGTAASGGTVASRS